MIEVRCLRCSDELDEPGAVLISPPVRSATDSPHGANVAKYHLCVACWGQFHLWRAEPRRTLEKDAP